MMTQMKEKTVIGRAELIAFPEIDGIEVHARIDSGARTSAIWGSAFVENDELVVAFFGDSKKTYRFPSYQTIIVKSSNGAIERRYKIDLGVVINGRKIRAAFTIANRQTQVYPVLVGRNILRGKFLVDVTLGKTLTEEMKQRTASLKTLQEKEELL